MQPLFHIHGGDLDAIEKAYGIPKGEISDFSGNINPLGFPKEVWAEMAKHPELASTYPDKRYTALKEAIAGYTGAKAEHVVVGNGSTELIRAFIQTADAKNSIILGPAYSEYEREITLAGGHFTYFPLKEEDGFQLQVDRLLEALTEDVGLFVACNPNNPTGTAISTADLERIFAHCKEKQISVMIDETYIEFAIDPAAICAIALTAKYDNVFVIRGISKFFCRTWSALGLWYQQQRDIPVFIGKKTRPLERKQPRCIRRRTVIFPNRIPPPNQRIGSLRTAKSHGRTVNLEKYSGIPFFFQLYPAPSFNG